MNAVWTVNGQGRYPSLAVAKMRAEQSYPGVSWGNPYQGTNGRIRVIGRTSNDGDDRIVIEQRRTGP